jgi:DNA topoisomerase-3
MISNHGAGPWIAGDSFSRRSCATLAKSARFAQSDRNNEKGKGKMKTIIAEKPSVARDIARVLNCNKKRDGYIEGNGYKITWAFGHLVEIAMPEKMNESWAGAWSLEKLPMLPERWAFTITKDGKKQFNVIKKLFNASNEIICATDAGREGEHIFRLIYKMTGCEKPIKRLWISSLTDKSIQRGFADLHDGKDFNNLAAAAMSRAKADWITGLNFTRAYTVHNGQLCTVGRVQTPTLALIVNREHEITRFKKSFYYEIVATLKEGFKAKYVNDGGKHALDDKSLAEAIYSEIKGAEKGNVKKVAKKTKRQNPPPLYNLLGLQKDGNQLYGITAASTLKIAQALYEKHKLISYPRTESCHISTDMVDGLRALIRRLPENYKKFKDRAVARIDAGHKLSKAYVDDHKLTDHHAIIPTGKKFKLEELSENEKSLYILICERFISIFLPGYVTEETKIELEIENRDFLARGTREVSLGWRELKKPEKRKDTLPEIKGGQTLYVDHLELQEKERKPPKRYNEASLLTAMKSAGKKIDDKSLAELIKKSGLGTPATRAAIIERLIKTGYIKREKKNLLPTQKGIKLIGRVDETIKNPEMTAAWEEKLKKIEHGEYKAADFDQAIADFVKKVMPMVEKSEKFHAPEKESLGKCPACKEGEVVENLKAYGCNRWKDGCKFAIWKEIAKKEISRAIARELMEKGKTKRIKGFKSKKGKSFSTMLKLDNGKVSFEFERT